MLTCLFCKIINNINSTVCVNFKMSDNPQIAALYQVSQVLLKAFQQINQITGNILNKQTTQSQKNTPKEEQKPKSNPPIQDKGKNKNDKKVNNPTSETVQKLPVQEKVSEQIKKSSKKQQLQEKIATKKSQGEDKKKQNHPDKPKQPITPFFRFNAVIIEQIKKEYPELNQQDLVKASGGIWQKLTPEQKKPYQQQFAKDKQVYTKDLAKFYEKHPEEKKKN